LAELQRCDQRKPPGFTLVELLVAITILVVGLLGVCQLFLAAVWTMQKANYLALASERAQHELEFIQGLGYQGLQDDPLIAPERFPADEYCALSTGRGVQFTEEGLPGGRGTIRIVSPDDTPGLLCITIDIEWDGATKSQSTVVLSTLLSATGNQGGVE
jgi:prepilin-type N-terminal cleavage/methylation domain-containing protein